VRTAPVPRVLGPVRQAAITPSDAPVAQAVTVRGSTGGSGRTEKAFLDSYSDWQSNAKAAARTVGVARFTANLFASTAGRVELRIEYENDNGDWVPARDVVDEVAGAEQLLGLMADYRNVLLGQTSNELMRFHAWHYQVAGEGLLVSRDNAQAGVAEWLVMSTRAAEWDKPEKGSVTLRFTPNGRLSTADAFGVPRKQVVRFWMPDEEYVLLPVSPMTAAMEDLRRWQDLTRYARRQAQNYLAMNGILWTPKSAHEQDPDAPVDDADVIEQVAKVDPLVKMYQDIASTSISRDDRLESVVPPMMWWDGPPPEYVQVGRGLDAEGMAHRAEALDDWARGVDAPAALIRGGGNDDASNHWGAWLTEERFLGSVAPLIDRITHQDLTTTYLLPYLRYFGNYDLRRWRVGYDATDVVVHPDKSGTALQAYLAGLLGDRATLRYMGFDEDEIADTESLERLAFVMQKGMMGGPPGTVTTPVDGPTVDETMPEEPGPGDVPLPELPADLQAAVLGPYAPPGSFTLPAYPEWNGIAHTGTRTSSVAVLDRGAESVSEGTPPTGAEEPLVAAEVDSVVTGLRTGTGSAPRLARSRPSRVAALRVVETETKRYRRVLDRLATLRRDTGRKLLAGAEVALAEALRLAGVRAIAKGKSKSRVAATALAQAISEGSAWRPHLAALGITEEQMLTGAFDAYTEQARGWLSQRRAKERAMLAREGFDPDVIVPDDDHLDEAAAVFLGVALMAIARQRIMGDPTTLDTPGEVTGAVPARFAANAMRIADGTAVAHLAESADAVPAVVNSGATSVEGWVSSALRDRLGNTLTVELSTTSDERERQEITEALGDLDATSAEYVWVHGFYGEPTTIFEPHLNLDGVTTTDPDGDPAFYNDEAWPEERMFFPGDHLGCSCELVPLLTDNTESMVLDVVGGGEGPIPGGREDTGAGAQGLRSEAARISEG
jgi:hypothetical protein